MRVGVIKTFIVCPGAELALLLKSVRRGGVRKKLRDLFHGFAGFAGF